MRYLRLALLLAALPLAAVTDPIKTSGGQLSGAPGKNEAVRAYKGIPYAAPPVGDLRWKEPQAPAPWSGVRAATEFGAQCMQAPYAENSPYYSAPHPTSEDC